MLSEFSKENFNSEIFHRRFSAVNFNSTNDRMLQVFGKDTKLNQLQVKINFLKKIKIKNLV